MTKVVNINSIQNALECLVEKDVVRSGEPIVNIASVIRASQYDSRANRRLQVARENIIARYRNTLCELFKKPTDWLTETEVMRFYPALIQLIGSEDKLNQCMRANGPENLLIAIAKRDAADVFEFLSEKVDFRSQFLIATNPEFSPDLPRNTTTYILRMGSIKTFERMQKLGYPSNLYENLGYAIFDGNTHILDYLLNVQTLDVNYPLSVYFSGAAMFIRTKPIEIARQLCFQYGMLSRDKYFEIEDTLKAAGATTDVSRIEYLQGMAFSLLPRQREIAIHCIAGALIICLSVTSTYAFTS